MKKGTTAILIMKKITLLCLLVVTNFYVSIICYAETFYLKNGDIVEGRVVEENAKGFKLEHASIKTPGSNFPLETSVYYLKKDEISKTEEAGALSREFSGEDAGEGRKIYKETKSWEYYHSGLDLAAVGEFEKAEKEFQDSLKVDKFYTSAIESLWLIKDTFNQKIKKEVAMRMFKVGASEDWSSQIRELEEIANLESDYMMTHTILGIVYLENNMLDKAMIEFKKAVRIEPNRAIAHNNLGVIYVYKKMFNEAIHEFKVALQFNPDLAEARNNLELIEKMQELKEWKEDFIKNVPIGFAFKTSSIFVLER